MRDVDDFHGAPLTSSLRVMDVYNASSERRHFSLVCKTNIFGLVYNQDCLDELVLYHVVVSFCLSPVRDFGLVDPWAPY